MSIWSVNLVRILAISFVGKINLLHSNACTSYATSWVSSPFYLYMLFNSRG